MGAKIVTGTDGVAAKDFACVDQLGGGGTVSSVNAGTGISITGTGSAPIVNNTGVLGITNGANITIGGTAANPIISAPNQQGGFVWIFAFGFGPSGAGANVVAPGGSSYLRPYTRSQDFFISTGDALVCDYYCPIAVSNVDGSGTVKAYSALGVANSLTIEITKNGAPSGIGGVISGTGVFGLSGGPVAFAGGDLIGVKQTAGGTVGVAIDYTITLTGIPT